MPELTPYQKAWAIRTLQEIDNGENNTILMDTVFKLQVAAIVQLDKRVAELEARNA